MQLRPYVTMIGSKPVDALEPHEATEAYPDLTIPDMLFLSPEAFDAVRDMKPGFRATRDSHGIVWHRKMSRDEVDDVTALAAE